MHASTPTSPKETRLGFTGVTSFTVANMIGTGVFTTLGFQLLDLHTPFALLALWVVGGLIALCGSLVYGELGAAMPRSGGEYHYLSVIYHPAVGFLSGFVSLTIGFAAPVALACMALGHYTAPLFPEGVTAQMIAIGALLVITAVHMWSVRGGSRFQNVFTLLKLALIVAFVVCGFIAGSDRQPFLPVPDGAGWRELLSPAFAVCLIYVSYAYSGWNASAYVAGEVRDPQRTLPRSLLWGVTIVAVAYVALNATFLSLVPHEEMRGKLEVGFIAAQHLFGPTGASLMAGVIGLLLVSSISSMIFVGPRVSQVMGEDYRLFRFLSHRTQRGTPAVAVAVQSSISLLFILSGSFEQVVTFSGFILSLFTFLSVLGVFVHRRRYPKVDRPYKTWGYPVTPILFLLLTGWTMVFLLIQKTAESVLGIFTLGIGLGVYALCRWREVVASYKVRMTSYESRSTSEPSSVTKYKLQITRNGKAELIMVSNQTGKTKSPKGGHAPSQREETNNPKEETSDSPEGEDPPAGDGDNKREKRRNPMVITYDNQDGAHDNAEEGRERGMEGMKEDEYFYRYRKELSDLFYNTDGGTAEGDNEPQEVKPQSEPAMDETTRELFRQGLSEETEDSSHDVKAREARMYAMRFAIRLLHFSKAGEDAPDDPNKERLEQRLNALLNELNHHPRPEVLQVGREYFFDSDNESMDDYLTKLVDYCFAEEQRQRAKGHPFRRGGIAVWPNLMKGKGPFNDEGFMGVHLN